MRRRHHVGWPCGAASAREPLSHHPSPSPSPSPLVPASCFSKHLPPLRLALASCDRHVSLHSHSSLAPGRVPRVHPGPHDPSQPRMPFLSRKACLRTIAAYNTEKSGLSWSSVSQARFQLQGRRPRLGALAAARRERWSSRRAPWRREDFKKRSGRAERASARADGRKSREPRDPAGTHPVDGLLWPRSIGLILVIEQSLDFSNRRFSPCLATMLRAPRPDCIG